MQLVLMRCEKITHLDPESCSSDSVCAIGKEIAAAHAALQHYPRPSELARPNKGPVEELLTRSVIHGDLYLANLSLRSDGRVFLFDWEAVYAPVIEDLAILSVNLFTASDISFTRWQELRGWLLAGYTGNMTLTTYDLEALPTFTISASSNLVQIYSKPSADFTNRTTVVQRCHLLADFLRHEASLVKKSDDVFNN